MDDEKKLNEKKPPVTPKKKEVGRWESEGGQPLPEEAEPDFREKPKPEGKRPLS